MFFNSCPTTALRKQELLKGVGKLILMFVTYIRDWEIPEIEGYTFFYDDSYTK